MNSYNILICGYGNIGQHLYSELEILEKKKIAKIDIYDKYKSAYNNIDFNKFYDFIFIAVPTEMNSDGSANVSEVKDCINRFTNVDTFVIKSAIPIGLVESFNKENIIISPEQWGTTQHCPDPDFLILGGNKLYAEKVVQLYNHIKNGYYKYYITDLKTAALSKYMDNCWIAAKVTFCNEFADIAKQYGISYSELRELWLADKRISPSHTLVYNDKPYYDSHCINKDVPALISFCKDSNIKTPLMESINNINISRKNNK